MILTPTFEFKGSVLPVVDRTDKLYMFVKNDCDHRVLLNFVTYETNKFVYVDKNSKELVQCGVYKSNLQLKVFYMGQELFDFSTSDIDKTVLMLYSDYIFDSNTKVDNVYFSSSFVSGCNLKTSCVVPQRLYIKIINSDTNEIIHEDVFVSGNDCYHFIPDSINYEVLVLNSNGEQIYKTNKKS